ncbi:hypothetical protein KUL25_04260 [Rhodobacteraceae bacterium N5(2021)]|nr:hypothetical protein [Gymnodinialimonas phycosphaerae]MBY4891975.1 hypothetical protein [Gymnodinialimonas phycosphaerae]
MLRQEGRLDPKRRKFILCRQTTPSRTEVAYVLSSSEAGTPVGDLQNSVDRHTNGELSLEWATVRLIADDPLKGQGIATLDQLMITQVGETLGSVENRLDLVSAYFVPGVQGTTYLTDLSERGIDGRILTHA